MDELGQVNLDRFNPFLKKSNLSFRITTKMVDFAFLTFKGLLNQNFIKSYHVERLHYMLISVALPSWRNRFCSVIGRNHLAFWCSD